MDNFKAVYHILRSLEEQMDNVRADISKFDHEQLGVSETRWCKYIAMMLEAGYITGCKVFENTWGEIIFQNNDIRITLKGLEYLQENSIMQRMYKAAKGIVDLIP